MSYRLVHPSKSFHLNIIISFIVARPSNSVLKSPGALGLYATRNFYVTHRDEFEEENVTLGVWHILPNYIAKRFSKQLKLSEVCDDDIVVLKKKHFAKDCLNCSCF